MKFTVRPAVPADAASIIRVRHQGWQETYGHLLAPEFLASMAADIEPRARRVAGRIAATTAEGRTADWVAFDDRNRMIGFAAAGPARPEHPMSAPGQRAPDPDQPLPEEELYALYLLARAQGGGAGQALLDEALGGRPAVLWVLEDNPRARAFYARNGFRPDGAALAQGPEWQGARQIRMVRR